jgi:hypothetical protein
MKGSSTKIPWNFRRKWWNGEKSYCTCPLFIGRGVVSRNHLEMTIAEFQGDTCPLTFRGWRFYRNSEDFSWKRIVGVNPLPQGASVGELGKNLSPSKCRSCLIREYVAENLFRDKETFVKVLWWFCTIHWSSNIVRNSRRMDPRPWVYCLFQDSRNLANSGRYEPANFGKHKDLWTLGSSRSLGSWVQMSGDLHE